MIKLEMTYSGLDVKVNCTHTEYRNGLYINNHDFLTSIQKLLDSLTLYDNVELSVKTSLMENDTLVSDYPGEFDPAYAVVSQEKC